MVRILTVRVSMSPLFVGVAALVAALAASPVDVAAAVPTPLVKTVRADAGQGNDRIIAYKGKLVDETGKPISGIFPMTFKLFAGLKAKKPIWSDSMWVAVDRGTYVVPVGERKPLPARQDLDKLILGVEIRGVGEVAREPFVAAVHEAPAAAVSAAARAGSTVKFADTAGFAVEADNARNADRLNNLTADEVIRRAAEEGGGAAGQRAKVGTSRRFGSRVGGPGGVAEYNESCPKGHVMTGIRGATGNVVDSIQIVCSPIE